MSERSCPVSGSVAGGDRCPGGGSIASPHSRTGPRGCSFSGFTQPGDVHAAFNIPSGVDVDDFLRARERKTINEVLYSDIPSADHIKNVKNVDTLTADDRDLLAIALGAPARQVIIRAEEIGPRTGWKDGYMSAEHGFCPPDYNEAAGALANSPGRVWSDLCERMPGCVSRGRVRESVAALPFVDGGERSIPDQALWAAVVALGMLCSIYRYEERNDGYDGVSVAKVSTRPQVEMADYLGPELEGIPTVIGLPFWQISRRMGRAIPHLSFLDQASYNLKVRDPTSTVPYVGRFDNTDLRWPMFGERTEIAFLKGCADTAASFQHGPDAIAACQEHVMTGNIEGLLREMIRLKEILERMPNAFHSISTNPSSGENYVSAMEWVRWGKFSAPLSKRCPAASGLQFPPYLVMDAFLGRKKYDSFLGNEGLHLRAWLPSNLRAFIAAIDYHYRVPEFVARSGDPRLMGVLDGIIEAYTGERGFMGVHRYKVFGILEVASKTGRTETNGNSGAADVAGRPWEEVHQQFSDAMKERLEPYRGTNLVEPHEMRGTFEECRYKSRILNRAFVDSDPERSLAMVTLDLHNTGVTFQPGDRLAVMPLNSWEECAKVVAALGLESMLDSRIGLDRKWGRFAEHLEAIDNGPGAKSSGARQLTVKDILRRGHLAPLTKELVLKIHAMLRASSNVVLQVLATTEWPVRGSLGDLLQAAIQDTPPRIWDRAFDLSNDLSWLSDLIPVEVPRTYSISNYPEELLPSSVDLTVSRSEYKLCSTFAGSTEITRSGVSSGFLNPCVASPENALSGDEDVLVGVSRPASFQLPLDGAAPCAYFAGGSGIAPFRSFWQARVGRTVGRNILYLGVQSREKFCYEDEIRHHVNAGQMEAHLAFSRDSRGLAYDAQRRDLVEKKMEPRYIDALIAEQGATVCDLVMSKKQGGLGGYLYICGSVAVFDSVMSGIRKAIYNHRTATMDSTDLLIDTAFAERRIMLDVFMTPKPLPCNLPTIPLSQLALHTGHRPGSRIWLGVHGSVYDVTDFLPMHPGGTLIIKSNAGVDCSTSFDKLAHTNNPEVSSLLTKYFVGHLTPKPDYGCADLSGLYDMWSDYLRTSVETLVAQQFEMDDLMGSSEGNNNKLWFQGGLVNMLGVRIFYQYQSRLLQGGFSALFGPKFQELVLRLSFALASSSSSGGADVKLPDILGTVNRAKTSASAVATSKEVALVGQLICDGESARFQERGIMDYADKSVRLDMALLEDIREEACRGMDAFDSVANLEVSSDQQRLEAVCTFLMQILERMAKLLEVFYSDLAQHSIYKPDLETNPARTRWNLVRRRIRDGSFFFLTDAPTTITSQQEKGNHKPPENTVEFDNVLFQIQQTIREAPPRAPGATTLPLNERHIVRTQKPAHGSSAMESHENSGALNRMSTFIDRNRKAINRLSKLPPVLSLNQLAAQLEEAPVPVPVPVPVPAAIPTPPASRGSSRSPTRVNHVRAPSVLEELAGVRTLRRRNTGSSEGSVTGAGANYALSRVPPSPATTPPLDSAMAIQSMVNNLNLRSRGPSPVSTPRANDDARSRTGSVAYQYHSVSGRSRAGSSVGSLRAFKLGSVVQGQVPPTF
ncbi:related to nitric-oxide synthase, salivary gland [Cephalotrichum gorgonifer]|uniref:NADPH--hemoprotein reductase n=1 Tax=Cephalotrichum gorgonifer TaxID=2041049 RepID=A0AAE8SXZ9_9PEZI|nr:related to nitric-oxide synthase, salivary gland [Cephalotrichum gorgonifer]